MDYLLANLKSADLIRIEEGPIVIDFNQDDRGTLEFNWIEPGGEAQQERIMLHDLCSRATIQANRITVPNAEGEPLLLELFTLAPKTITTNLDAEQTNSLIHRLLTEQPTLEDALTEAMEEAVSELLGGTYSVPKDHPDHPCHPDRLHRLHPATRNAVNLALMNLEAVAIDVIAQVFGKHLEDIRQEVLNIQGNV